MNCNSLVRAGVVLGLGLGGFLDGIVLHQILGWHHLVCTEATCGAATVAQFKRQNTQDGYFHLAVWLLTIAGVGLLFRAARRQVQPWSGQAFGGAVAAGWGAFNFVEGLVDHQILGIHHVRPGHPRQFLFDMLFLGIGLILILGGGLVVRLTASSKVG